MVRLVTRETLFTGGDLSEVLRRSEKQVIEVVNQIPKEQFLHASEGTLLEHVVSELSIDPLEIYPERISLDHGEAPVDVSDDFLRGWPGGQGPIQVPGIRISISIPFTGDANLWKHRPSPFSSNFPYGVVRRRSSDKGELYLAFEQPSDESGENLQKEIQRQVQLLRGYLAWQRSQIEKCNSRLPELARTAIEARRKRLRQHEQIIELLDIPLKQRPGAPPIDPLPIKKRLIRDLPPSPKGGYKAEPGIVNEDYEAILKVIRYEGRSWESTPSPFSKLGEEDLRNIILAHLNLYFEGGATSETFRKSGKTDIRIEDKERAAFVAECKVWRGRQSLLEACEQLLGYLTWRDCKASIVIFNQKNRDFLKIRSEVSEVFRSHPSFLRELPAGEQHGEWRFVLSSAEDPGREVTVHILLFDLYLALKK